MNYQTLGTACARARKKQRLTQQQVSESIHISRVTLSQFENGSGDIGLRKVIQIIHHLGLELTLRDRSPFPTLEELMNEKD